MLSVPLLVTGVLAGVGGSAAASASACANWSGTEPPNPGANANALEGVAVLSACNAWAVGSDRDSTDNVHTLIEHWNGSSWAVTPSPDPGGRESYLAAVRGASPADIWAVGFYLNPDKQKTLVLHWDGHAWKQVTSPHPGEFSELTGVRVVSASNAWAVGDYGSGSTEKPHSALGRSCVEAGHQPQRSCRSRSWSSWRPSPSTA